DRILQLPRGYDTVLGEEAALSGGEAQRIALARALLADTPVLVLDEATAFADPRTELAVRRTLTSLGEDRTVLVIAHRLETARAADTVVVLRDGRIVERGTPDELLVEQGEFTALWQSGRAGEVRTGTTARAGRTARTTPRATTPGTTHGPARGEDDR